jgi:hypothetical protein
MNVFKGRAFQSTPQPRSAGPHWRMVCAKGLRFLQIAFSTDCALKLERTRLHAPTIQSRHDAISSNSDALVSQQN